MSKPLVLTCDIGTQSARALLVDPDGRIVDVVQSKYAEPYFSKEPGWAEQKPNFYFDRLCECCRELCARSNALLPDVIAMTITVIRDTVVCLDANNEPLRDIILWLDKRTVDPNGAMPAKNMMLFKVAGMEPTAKVVYAASVGNWIMRHEPEIWARTAKYVMLPTYLNYKLTGNLIDSASNQIGHIPFDYKNRRWMKPGSLTRCFCDVPNEKLCDLVPSGTVIGTVTDEVCALTGIPAGLPLISTGSDKGCETLGLAVVDSDKASISLGTTATIQFSTTEYVEPQQFLPAYPGVLNDHYNPEIEIYRGLWLLSWFVKEFGTADAIDAKEKGIAPEALLDERIRDLPAGSDGLLLQPYWTAGILHPDSLGAVIGFSDLLRDGGIPEAEAREYLDSISYSGNALLQLINDVLDLSKLEADQMKIEPAPIDFRELGEEVMKVFQYRAGEQQIELRVEMPPLPEMELDKLRVRQVLFNLIGNAVKFTCEGSVTLKAEYQPDHDGTCEFTFLVIDTGPGIAPEDQARLMEPFVQLSRIRGAAAGNSGTGLGLTISRRLIEKMGGTLWLKSEPGRGSVFGATLRHIRISKERKPAEPSEDKAPACGRASALSILIVDDVAMNLKVMKALCRKAGIEKIETALSGKEALALLEAHSFDLVLTDMWMPEMNGAALAGKIRADRRFQEMPILAVTADVEARDNFPLEFFNGVLLKPVTLEKIRKMLGSVQGMGV